MSQSSLKRYTPLYEFETVHAWRGNVGNITAVTYAKRKKLKGIDDRGVTFDKFDPGSGIADFHVVPTESNEGEIFDHSGNSLGKSPYYTTEIQFVDYEKWIVNWAKTTLREFQDFLGACEVKFDCNCGSYHWWGMRYQGGQVDSAIYPTKISDPVRGGRPGVESPKSQGDANRPVAACKHIDAVIEKLIRHPDKVLEDIKAKVHVVQRPEETPVKPAKKIVRVKKPQEPEEKKPKKETPASVKKYLGKDVGKKRGSMKSTRFKKAKKMLLSLPKDKQKAVVKKLRK